MLLLGAGASVPFGIPTMANFTTAFWENCDDTEKNILTDIKNNITNSQSLIGINLNYDLELLLSVLMDLSRENGEKPLSLSTCTYLFQSNQTLSSLNRKKDVYRILLEKLQFYIFEKCIDPIKYGEHEGSFQFLDDFYGPLFTVLNRTDFKNIPSYVKNVFTTNWDICLKYWTQYINIPFNDGIDVDNNSNPIFTPNAYKTYNSINYYPLHGSIDLFEKNIIKGRNNTIEIFKNTNIVNLKADKEYLKKMFIIYPLEAIGYETYLMNPYFDLLKIFREKLSQGSQELEEVVYIIGSSLRDSTLISILDQIIKERIRSGAIVNTYKEFDDRKREIHNEKFKIIIFTTKPYDIQKYLENNNRNSLANVFIPLEVRFPSMFNSNDATFNEAFKDEYIKCLRRINENLLKFQIVGNDTEVKSSLKNKYGIIL